MKLVREYINEKFTDDSDPVKDLGIGIKVGDIVKLRDDIKNENEYGSLDFFSFMKFSGTSKITNIDLLGKCSLSGRLFYYTIEMLELVKRREE